MALNKSRILAMLDTNFSEFKSAIQVVGMSSLVLQDKLDECPNIELTIEDDDFYNSLSGEESKDNLGVECKINGVFLIRRDFFGGLYESTFVEGFECQTYESTINAYRHQADLLKVGLDNNIFILDTEETTTPIVDTINAIKEIKDFINDIESKNKNNDVL